MEVVREAGEVGGLMALMMPIHARFVASTCYSTFKCHPIAYRLIYSAMDRSEGQVSNRMAGMRVAFLISTFS